MTQKTQIQLLAFLIIILAAACSAQNPPEVAPSPTTTRTPLPTATATQVPTPTPTAREMAEPLYEEAFALQLEEDYAGAIDVYTAALALDPDFAEAFLNRGICHYMEDDYEAANTDLARAFEIGFTPNTPQMFVNRGRGRAMLDDFDGAISEFDKALELDPEFVEAYVRRANTYIFLEEYDLARVDLEKAEALDPNEPLVHLKWAYFYEETGDLEAALARYDSLIELQPDEPWNHFNRGLVCAQMGEFDLGITDMQKTVALDPDFAYAYYFMGLMYDDTNQLSDAVEQLELAIAAGLEPEDEDYAREVIEGIRNPPELIVLDPGWLVTVEEIATLTENLDIGYWEFLDDLHLEVLTCVAHRGQSWSVSWNVSENCIYMIEEGMTLDTTIEIAREVENLTSTTVRVQPKSSYDADYAVFVDSLDNGHGNYIMYLVEDELLYVATISMGQGGGSTPAGFYESAGEKIDELLYNIIQINRERRQVPPEPVDLVSGTFHYSGITSQGEQVLLTVEGGMLTFLQIDYDIAGCEDFNRMTILSQNIPIVDAVVNDDGTTITFHPDGTASGTTLIESNAWCEQELEVTWTALSGYTPAPPSAFDLLTRAYESLKTSNFHFNYSELYGPMFIMEDGDYQSQGNWNLTKTFGTPDEQAGVETHDILLNGVLYETDPESGAWQSETLKNPEVSIDRFLNKLTAANPGEVENLTLVGEEVLNGEPVYYLKGNIPTQNLWLFTSLLRIIPGIQPAEEGSIISYWISVKDGRFRLITVEGGLLFLGDPWELEIRTEFSQYDQEKLIEPPE